MSTELVATGSMADVATKGNTSVAESFVSCDAVVVIDVSSSMKTRDGHDNQRRYDVACAELAELQRTLPGRVAVIAFSDTVIFVPGGLPPMIGGGTDLAAALQFAKVADVPDMRFIIISDGEPNDEHAALDVASRYTNRIDTIYVGPREWPAGQAFLQRLANASGGASVTADRAAELADRIETLLLGGGTSG